MAWFKEVIALVALLNSISHVKPKYNITSVDVINNNFTNPQIGLSDKTIMLF